jgi:hypothetical protein
MRDDARGPEGGSIGPVVAVEEASEGAGSRNTAARAATGRVAEASSDSLASMARQRASAGWRGGGRGDDGSARPRAAWRRTR